MCMFYSRLLYSNWANANAHRKKKRTSTKSGIKEYIISMVRWKGPRMNDGDEEAKKETNRKPKRKRFEIFRFLLFYWCNWIGTIWVLFAFFFCSAKAYANSGCLRSQWQNGISEYLWPRPLQASSEACAHITRHRDKLAERRKKKAAKEKAARNAPPCVASAIRYWILSDWLSVHPFAWFREATKDLILNLSPARRHKIKYIALVSELHRFSFTQFDTWVCLLVPLGCPPFRRNMHLTIFSSSSLCRLDLIEYHSLESRSMRSCELLFAFSRRSQLTLSPLCPECALFFLRPSFFPYIFFSCAVCSRWKSEHDEVE